MEEQMRALYRKVAASAALALTDEVRPVPGGFRMKVCAVGEEMDDLCEHTHPSPEEAWACVKEGGCQCAFHISTEQVDRCIQRRKRNQGGGRA